MKKRGLLFCLFLGLVFFLFIYFLPQQNFLRLSFLDVGQGDACLLNFNNEKIILLDGGPSDILLRRLGESLPFYKRKIDLVIISHFHEDHINGLVELFRRYQIDTLVFGEGLEKKYPAEIIFQEATRQGTKMVAVKEMASLVVNNDCQFKLWNLVSRYTNDDNNSLVTKLECHQFSFLAAGDNELAAEKIILDSQLNIEANIFKASHHGADNANSQKFLEKIKPQFMIISVGEDNKFGHPSEALIKRANDLGIIIKRTDQLGSINIFTNLR
ncbi:MAG: competence protein ComEC [Patescibacteria group bacterium]|nr:competence protein ComEC [Patescibacteria group bacterium]